MRTWLESLEMQGYQELFATAGYKHKGDLESLKGLKADDLKKLGILKKGNHPTKTTVDISPQCMKCY